MQRYRRLLELAWEAGHEFTGAGSVHRKLVFWGLSYVIPAGIGSGTVGSQANTISGPKRPGFGGSANVVTTGRRRNSASTGTDSLLGRRGSTEGRGARPGVRT